MIGVLTLPFASKAIAGACISIMAGTGVYVAATSNGITKTVNDVFAACGLCNVDAHHQPKPWSVKKVTKTDHGYRLVMKFPYGKTLADVTRKADAINTALGVDVAFTREGTLLIMDVPLHPLPSYLSYSDKVLELTRGTWRVPIGYGSAGWAMHDFDERPHLLVAGQTRGGKSVLLKSLISTLYLSHSPAEFEFIGVDMKPCSLEFRKFYNVWSRLESTPQGFLGALMEAGRDMLERAKLLAADNCSSVKEYEATTGRKFTRRFIIVDEYGKSFGSDVEDDIMNEMMQVCAMGAGLGVHVILCTQRPDADVVNGKIRANVGTVVCFQVANDIQSRVVLGHSGAENLPGIAGRAIYQTEDEEIVQVPFLSDAKLSKLMPRVSMRQDDKSGYGPLKLIKTRSPRSIKDYED